MAQPHNAQQHNTETGVPHDAGHKGAFPPLDPNNFAPQLIWLAITFALLYWLLSKIALPRIGEVIEERRDRIQRDLDAAEALKSETERAIRDYEQSLADARTKAGGIARETREKLAQQTDNKRRDSEAQVAAKIAEAEGRIADMKANALASVSDIASETASAIVAKLIGDNVSAAEAKKHL
ncbi:MAG: F0F1 ATP synthase subunit B [Hyphomicrobiaceae bacterium]|nr:F0F1 ATP synthase subunit B [Hyphomicrobiaceae bacterium]MCC0008351.1 F0F1 ATP synthase subunit B [Hyphomicrobiaceae bacterium]